MIRSGAYHEGNACTLSLGYPEGCKLCLLSYYTKYKTQSLTLLTLAEDAIRAMLDRDAKEAEDDNLFNIPAGTEFDANLDDDDEFGDDDDFDIDYHG